MKRRGFDLNKKAVASFQLVLMISSLFAFAFILDSASPVSAETASSDPSTCCEKTVDGASCVNTDESQCAPGSRSSPTSCETTSYCKLGTCYDSGEGICMENTPQSVCSDNGGLWDARSANEVPQCQLGCCIIGDQASFVPLVRCKKLSSFFGMENNYRTDINSEVACIAAAQSQDKGACVFEKDFERICEFTTRSDCGASDNVEGINETSSGKTFYKDMLCSAEELGTACARQTSTTCNGEDVYWTDSCGNLENAYSSDKSKSWNNGRVLEADAVCDPNSDANTDCGNCDYLEGTRCAEWDGVLGLGSPADSDYYCQKTECIDRNGDSRLNGESWCVNDPLSGQGLDPAGSRYFREICVDGDVTVEACADYRNSICIEGKIETASGNDFGTAACRVNRWQDCTLQLGKSDCENNDIRDCKWVSSVEGLMSNGRRMESGVCVPNNSPGLDFWEDGGAKNVCGAVSARCDVLYEKGLLDSWDVAENGECLSDEWALSVNRACSAAGDCGGYVNYQEEFTDDGYSWKINGERKRFTPNQKNLIGNGYSGYSVDPFAYSSVANNFERFLMTSAGIATATYIAHYFVSSAYIASGTAAGAAAGAAFGGAAGAAAGAASGAAAGAGAAALPSIGWTAFWWTATAYGVGLLLGSLFGMDDEESNAIATSIAASAFTYQLTNAWAVTTGTNFAKWYFSGGIGLVVYFLVFYKDTKVEVVSFECKPWQAPRGGDDCEACNEDDGLPCSEYRCKSLGQTCEIVNQGTEQESCVNVNPRDVNPPVISPSESALTSGLEYTNVVNSPPSPGFEIIDSSSSDGCLKAFTPIEFGINTNELSQCRIDFNHTTEFDLMRNFVGGDNLYLYNHSESFVLPSVGLLENSSFELQNGNEMNYFIRCMDKTGNSNTAEYEVSFCIDPSPDTTSPTIEATSINNGACVAENQDVANVEFYVNEPAQCRWSSQDNDYDSMQNEMQCASQPYQINAQNLWTCAADFEGISRADTQFYVRCKDQPNAADIDRNKMSQSFEFSLHGSTGLKMKNLKPNSTVFGAVSPMPVELRAETLFGCDGGRSICYYSDNGIEGDYVSFFDTNNADGISTQMQSLAAGQHEYNIRCIDEGGNLVEDTLNFNLDIDENAPVIARVYEENSFLKIVTVRDSQCSYSLNDCDFGFDEGTQMPYANTTTHVTDWNKDDTYYIKCRDEFKNEEADCSLVVRPTGNFF